MQLSKTIEPVKVKIECTYDYNKFKFVGVNRKVDKKHVRAIADAIDIRNLLHLFPVIVNSKWEVMDGQHRITAVMHIELAKRMKLPVYYIMDPNVTLQDIHLLNSNKVNWKNVDYINFYAGQKKKDFVELVKFMEKHPYISLSTCLEIVSSKSRDMKALRNGSITIDHITEAHYILECVYDLRLCMDPIEHLWKGRSFITAMRDIISTGKYDHAMMMASPYNKRDQWVGQHTKRQYIIEIDRIYNSDLQPKHRVDFRLLTKHLI